MPGVVEELKSTTFPLSIYGYSFPLFSSPPTVPAVSFIPHLLIPLPLNYTTMQKIRYRLVYNRKNQLNHQGTALVQVEAKLNQRNIYLTTNIYLQPEHWDKNSSQVINHPQAIELNALLFEFIIHLQAIELGFWKRGIQPTLALLFDGKALEVIDRYPSVEELAAIPSNCETNKLLAEVGKLAGVKKHFTYHTARHTCATLLVHQGVAITTVQKVLGHTSVKTTQIYSEVLSDTIVRDLKSIRKRKRL
nr:MAG TPA: SITE SPECIFIC RECOMBINASE XERD [Caudoviricetes sp.]